MPAFNEHAYQAQHNIDFLKQFILKHANDWAITIMFYSAVHIAEAMICKKVFIDNRDFNAHCSNHGERERVIKELFPEYHFQYTQLSKSAHDGRYKVYRFTEKNVIFHRDKYFIPIIQCFNDFCTNYSLNTKLEFNTDS
jgi:hypothetical protein